MRRLLLLALICLTGCSHTVRTAGTANKPVEELAVLHLHQHDGLNAWHGQPIHIQTFYVDQAEYGVTGDRDYLLAPGPQTLGIDYGPCVHGFGALAAPLNVDNELYGGPFGRFDVVLEAGAHYELTATNKLTGQNAVQTEHQLRRVPPPPTGR